MKNFSVPRLTLVLWFAIYTFYSLVSYASGTRHEIMWYLVCSAVSTAVVLVALGLIEDVA